MIRFFIIAILLCVIAGILVKCYEKPLYNWDTLAYTAIILSAAEEDFNKVHALTYETAKKEIPLASYQLLVDTTHHLRRQLLESPVDFHRFLSFFKIKPLYTGLAQWFHSLGIPLVKSTVLPSILSVFLLYVIVSYQFSLTYPYWLAGILGLCILCTPPMIEAARLSSPDALSSLVLMSAFLLFLNHKKWYWVILLLSISVLVRLDNLVLASVISASLLFSNSYKRDRSMVLTIIVCITAMLLYTFIVLKMSEYDNGFEAFYGGLYKKGNPSLLVNEAFVGLNTLQTSYLAVVGIGLVAVFYKKDASLKQLNASQYLFLMVLASSLVRYILFPDLATRFFLAVYILSWVFIVESIAGLRKFPMNNQTEPNIRND